MWLTPNSTAARSNRTAFSGVAGGPKTFGPVKRMAPRPMAETEKGPNFRFSSISPGCWSPLGSVMIQALAGCGTPSTIELRQGQRTRHQGRRLLGQRPARPASPQGISPISIQCPVTLAHLRTDLTSVSAIDTPALWFTKADPTLPSANSRRPAFRHQDHSKWTLLALASKYNRPAKLSGRQHDGLCEPPDCAWSTGRAHAVPSPCKLF